MRPLYGGAEGILHHNEEHERMRQAAPVGLLGGIHALFHGSDLGCAYGGMSCPARMRLQQLLDVDSNIALARALTEGIEAASD